MAKIIVYGSQYGTAKVYAEELARQTGIEISPYDEAKSLQEYQVIIHIGGVYEEGVDGLKASLFKAGRDNELIIITVGLADVDTKENTDKLKAMIKKQISQEDYKRAKIFHLRGGIDYKNLNFIQKFMMKMVYKKVKKVAENEKTDEMKAMIESYEDKVDFIDFSRLAPILEEINKL